MELKEQIDPSKLPQHVAVIMDGNGRWAKQNGKARIYGHQRGVESVRNIVETSSELGIKYLTLYAFSTENWSRPDQEVTALMELLVRTLKREIASLTKNNVKISVIGGIENMPANCRNELNDAMNSTAENDGLNLILALSYSGRWDIINAVKTIATEVKAGNLTIDDISEEKVSSFMALRNLPDPELLIRTSGEFRISNFLLWQLAYSELYFTKTLWPEFDQNEYYKALIDFQNRERRFGKISEQIKL